MVADALSTETDPAVSMNGYAIGHTPADARGVVMIRDGTNSNAVQHYKSSTCH